MTTPERLRRRQRIEGTLLVIMGALLAVSTYVNDRRDDNVQNCITEQVTGLTNSLNARAKLTDPRAKSVSDLIDRLLKANGDQAEGLRAVEDYRKKQAQLAKLTKAHPIPPFPNGKCD